MTAEGRTAYIGLGANLGDRFEALWAAVRGLDATPGVDVVRASPVYASEAHTLTPGEEQPAYLTSAPRSRR